MASTTESILMRVLNEPALVAAVQALAPAQLDALVANVGLEDAGELLAMATEEQLIYLVDDSLWRPDGDRERFDHARFPCWLEVMLEGGDALVAARLRALPEDTVTLAFSGQLLVLDRNTLGVDMAGASWREAEETERALDACQYLELGNYALISRRARGWDAVIAALLALDQLDHALLERVLDGCCRAASGILDEHGGLYSALSHAESLAEDADASREDRRAARGFVARADALAFVRLLDESPADTRPGAAPPPRDAITRAYLHRLTPTADRVERGPAPRSPARALLRELVPETAPAATPALTTAAARRLRDAMARLPAALRSAREAELLYLANLLVAAGRAAPVDAAQRVIELCARGREHVREHAAREHAAPLRTWSCVQLFRLGHALARDARDDRGE